MTIKVNVDRDHVEIFKATVENMSYANIVGKHADQFHDNHEVLIGTLEDMNDDQSDSSQNWNDLEIKMVRGEKL